MIRLGLWNQHALGALSKKLDLSMFQVECLLLLYLDHPCSLGDLAHKLYIDRSGLSRLLSVLEARGLIKRARGRTDRRAKQVTLTLDGIIVVQQIRSKADEMAIALLERLPEERQSQFVAYVRAIMSHAVPVENRSKRGQSQSPRRLASA
jgi:DNA-binding MarR family transcriptional regulator